MTTFRSGFHSTRFLCRDGLQFHVQQAWKCTEDYREVKLNRRNSKKKKKGNAHNIQACSQLRVGASIHSTTVSIAKPTRWNSEPPNVGRSVSPAERRFRRNHPSSRMPFPPIQAAISLSSSAVNGIGGTILPCQTHSQRDGKASGVL